MRSRSFLLILAVALVVSLSGADARAAGKAAADFSLRDLNNTTQTLSQYKGKVVLLNFWATWCGPCQVEMPHLQKLYTDLGPKGFVVIGISTDDAKSAAGVKPIVKSKGLTYPVLLDQQTSVVSQYNPAKTLPFNVLVDRKGDIVSVFSGYNPGDEVKVRQAVEALLALP